MCNLSECNLADSLDGAKLVKNSDTHGLVFAWFGGLGIHGYTPDGREVVYWTMGGPYVPDVAHVAQSIQSHIEEENFPY